MYIVQLIQLTFNWLVQVYSLIFKKVMFPTQGSSPTVYLAWTNVVLIIHRSICIYHNNCLSTFNLNVKFSLILKYCLPNKTSWLLKCSFCEDEFFFQTFIGKTDIKENRSILEKLNHCLHTRRFIAYGDYWNHVSPFFRHNRIN